MGLIKVSDPYSVQSLVALGLTAPQLADSLGVEKLVLGALYQTVDGVRLNVRVSSGQSGAVLSTNRYEWSSQYGFEAALNLAQAVTYLASAPKSNASYRALSEARRAAREHGSLPVPLFLRNAPTELMRKIGYGREYEYPHDAPDAIVPAECLPEELAGRVFYRPTDRGYEKKIQERLVRWRAIKDAKAKKSPRDR